MHSGYRPISSRGVVLDDEVELDREALFLGIQITYLLWGVQIAQSYKYYKSFRVTESRWLKWAVTILFITEALQSIFCSGACWRFLVQSLEKPPEQPIGWGGNTIPVLNTFTASIVHVFYAQKIWTLLGAPYKYIFTAIVLILSCLQLTAGIGCTVLMFTIDISFAEFARIKDWSSIWLLTAAMTDILITIIMSWKLSGSRTGIRKTDDIISKLIRLIIETGLATAIVQIMDIVLYLIWPLKPYHLIPTLLGPKVYSNSMLALLNSRKSPNADDVCFACENGKSMDNMIVCATQMDEVTDTTRSIDDQAIV